MKNLDLPYSAATNYNIQCALSEFFQYSRTHFLRHVVSQQSDLIGCLSATEWP